MTFSPRLAKPPRPVFAATVDTPAPDTPALPLFAFPPNRHTLGGTSYFIVGNSNLLVDCPPWDDQTAAFLREQGGVDWLVITHRGAIDQAAAIQQTFGCKLVIHEQEAYLLPKADITPFQQSLDLTPTTRVLWTPGHTPGSACVYHRDGGGILFTGRHLLPDPQGQLRPLKTSTTFHWPRQLRSIQVLLDEFTPATLHYICPGANLGFLRGQLAIADAYTHLQHSLP